MSRFPIRLALLFFVLPSLAFPRSLTVRCFGLLRPKQLVVRSLRGVLPLVLKAPGKVDTVTLLGEGTSLSCRLDPEAGQKGGQEGLRIDDRTAPVPMPPTMGKSLQVLGGGRHLFEMEVAGIAPRRFWGSFTLSAGKGQLRFIVTVDEEDYVASVAAAEMGGGVSEQALSALAVVIRSSLRHQPSRHRAPDVDRCDHTHCALFKGLMDGKAASRRLWRRARTAAKRCEGVVLCDSEGRPWPVWYSAACGGRTVSPSWVWPHGAPLRRRGRSCPACAIDAKTWTARIPEARLRRIFFPQEQTAPLRLVLSHGDVDYVRQIVLRCGSRRRRMRGERFRIVVGRCLGWNRIRSNRFRCIREGALFRFEGRGFGHSVGLCQAAASYLADQGFSWRDILRHAFPGAHFHGGAASLR